jgi:hypothetical protein
MDRHIECCAHSCVNRYGPLHCPWLSFRQNTGLASIENYDQRMSRARAAELMSSSTEILLKWSQSHTQISLILGRDYLPALNLDQLQHGGIESTVIEGAIGIKLNRLYGLLHGLEHQPRLNIATPQENRPLYFLPDWDDMLDIRYDFNNDSFSSPEKSKRGEQHCIQVMRPQRMCDGVLVSLAQHLGSKGVLRKFAPTDIGALAPRSIRSSFSLSADQWAFGDCGAFSYVNEPKPTVTTEQALSLYQIYGFDFGASVDHIPVPEVVTSQGKQQLSIYQQRKRVELTKQNAATFIELHRQWKCTFIPVGVIQGLSAKSYAQQLSEYIEMGYEHLGIGGLVPRSDTEILEIAEALQKAQTVLNRRLWIHLFGVFRPKLQPRLKELGITSFDSATYFRKAWLRSDQNYLSADGKWYAAIRIPMTSDPRTRKRLEGAGFTLQELEKLERASLRALHRYGERRQSLNATLTAIGQYDFILNRSEDHGENLLESYERTLIERPWEKCNCPICSSIGIDVVIFRGYNRNKRRGAHNTLMLYRNVS